MPEVKAYDNKLKSADAAANNLAFGTDSDGYLTVTIKNDVFDTAPEVFDFSSRMRQRWKSNRIYN